MSNYNVNYFLKDFSQRTIKNLKYIEDNSTWNTNNIYEVTQLINSFLGLIVFPVEIEKKWKNNYSCNSIESSVKENHEYKKAYESIESVIQKCISEKRLNSTYPKELTNSGQLKITVVSFIQHLRNSVSHGGNRGLHFYPITDHSESDTSITSIIFYDTDDFHSKSKIHEPRVKSEVHEFCVKLDVDEIRELLLKVSEVYSIKEQRKNSDKEAQEKYNSEISKLDLFLKYGNNDKFKSIFDESDKR